MRHTLVRTCSVLSSAFKRIARAAVCIGACVAACAGLACGSSSSRPTSRAHPPVGAAAPSAFLSSHAPAAAPAPRTAPPRANAPAFVRPTKPLTVAEARRYMVALINRDRKTESLPPVELDEGAPTIAGQRHAEDMARVGYLGHWGSDGSVPEQRYTEAGGADMVLENALCFTDEAKRALDRQPLIDPKQIERAESLFFNEVPPNDGHRRNILKPAHTRVGIGVAQPVETVKELAVPCFTQEFVDGYGTYMPLPRRTKVGATVHVEGTLTAGVQAAGIGVARIPTPKPLPTSELNKRRVYPVPRPYQTYWGPGFVSPIPLKVDGQRFTIDIPLSEKDQPGLYEISIWAKLSAGATEHTMVSLRTVLVE